VPAGACETTNCVEFVILTIAQDAKLVVLNVLPTDNKEVSPVVRVIVVDAVDHVA